MYVFTAILAGVIAQASAQTGSDPRTEFMAVCRVIQRAESYGATLDPREWFVVPQPHAGLGPRTVRLAFARGEPLALTIGPVAESQATERQDRGLEAWQFGERVVVRDSRGELHSFDAPLEFQRAEPRDPSAPPLGGAPGEHPPQSAEQGRGRKPAAAVAKFASRRVAMIAQLAPHVLLAGIEGKVDGEVTRTTTDGITTYRVAWLTEALRTFMPFADLPPLGEASAAETGSGRRDEPSARPQGTLEIDVDAAGSPLAIRIALQREMNPTAGDGAEPLLRTGRKLSIALARIGADPHAIPTDVRALFPL